MQEIPIDSKTPGQGVPLPIDNVKPRAPLPMNRHLKRTVGGALRRAKRQAARKRARAARKVSA